MVPAGEPPGPQPRRCSRCASGHDLARKHDMPDGLLPPGKFTWWRLLRLLGPGVIPPRSALRDLAAEVMFEAAEDGADIRPGDDALAGWCGAHVNSTRAGWAALASLGLAYRARDAHGPGRGRRGPGRAAVWELTMRMEHAALLEAAGYELAWEEGTRKYLAARKKTNSPDSGSFTGGKTHSLDSGSFDATGKRPTTGPEKTHKISEKTHNPDCGPPRFNPKEDLPQGQHSGPRAPANNAEPLGPAGAVAPASLDDNSRSSTTKEEQDHDRSEDPGGPGAALRDQIRARRAANLPPQVPREPSPAGEGKQEADRPLSDAVVAAVAARGRATAGQISADLGVASATLGPKLTRLRRAGRLHQPARRGWYEIPDGEASR